jgi:hypothetical protein
VTFFASDILSVHASIPSHVAVYWSPTPLHHGAAQREMSDQWSGYCVCRRSTSSMPREPNPIPRASLVPFRRLATRSPVNQRRLPPPGACCVCTRGGACAPRGAVVRVVSMRPPTQTNTGVLRVP